MSKLMKLALFALLALLGSNAFLADARRATTSAEEIFKQARAALGGDEALRHVQSLTVKGKYRRIIQDRDISGDREFDFQLPDKFRRSDTWTIGGLGMSALMSRTLNGSEFWSESSAPGGGVMIMRNGQIERPNKEQMEMMQKRQAEEMRAEFARYLLALLLNPPSGFNLSYSYAGEAVADDGRADVVDAGGPAGFATRIFFDKTTHLPLMLSYRGPKPRVMMMTARPTPGRSREEIIKEAEAKAREQPPERPEEAEYQWRFEDYRKVGGLLLPHRITQLADGEVNEEWEIKSYEINPQFKADKFQKK